MVNTFNIVSDRKRISLTLKVPEEVLVEGVIKSVRHGEYAIKIKGRSFGNVTQKQ